jgi:ABC-type amino acid transport substrate-binding protein
LIDQDWLPDRDLSQWIWGGDEVESSRTSTDVRIIDEPTRQWLSSVRGVGLTNVAGVDLPDAEYSLVMTAGNPLTACVDKALANMDSSGTVAKLQETWLDPASWTRERSD